MMMQPTPGSRIKELREEKFWSMKELAKRVYVTPSQISRIESGEIRSINSELLTLFADVFGVSADYILGRTTIRSQRNYDVSSLQLTEKTVRRMISGQLDMQVLNLMIENDRFPYMLNMIRLYFDKSTMEGAMTTNRIMDRATDALMQFRNKPNINQIELMHDMNNIQMQKIDPSEGEREKIRGLFMAILKDISKALPDEKHPLPAVNSEMLNEIQKAIEKVPREKLNEDVIIEVIIRQLEAQGEMDIETRAATRNFLKKYTEHAMKISDKQRVRNLIRE